MAISEQQHKRSPRAPSIALDEALERTLKIYEKDRLHPIPTDVAAQHMGYKSASNGTALQALASLRYYGLIDRPSDGMLAVNKDVEAYKYAHTEDLRKAFLRRFLVTPPLFAELMDRVQDVLPSDGSLKYELIQRGFIPPTAATIVTVFKRSVEFAGVIGHASEATPISQPEATVPDDTPVDVNLRVAPTYVSTPEYAVRTANLEVSHDRIPVRLSGNRRAWLEIPSTFYSADKQRLKAQIDLLITEDEDSGD